MSTKSFVDFKTSTAAGQVAVTEGPPRFVRCTFDRQSSGRSSTSKPKEYTYRVEPDVEVLVGQYAITRRNMSKVTIVAIDVEAVPGLDLSRYDFVDPISMEAQE